VVEVRGFQLSEEILFYINLTCGPAYLNLQLRTEAFQKQAGITSCCR
jgi:hypothetical protein